jgi:CubicO group peptidase (beta-lactamase class C family)
MIHGTCDHAFEPVREAFAANFVAEAPYQEVGAALCVYVANRPVVDLWGGFRDRARRQPWAADTLVNVWSTTKGLTAACLASLVDGGQIDYEAPVARYWPEFAQAGKAEITVAQVLSHQAGLPGHVEPTTLDDQLDWDRMCERLARQGPAWPPGTANAYHAMTYGWLAGEIVRRVAGISLGRFARETLSAPLSADFFIGLPEAFEPRVAATIGPEHAAPNEIDLPEVARMALVNPAQDPEQANSRAWRAAEIPAANGQASARGVARLYAALANGGTLDGVRVLSAATVDRMRAVQTTRADLMLGFEPGWAMGFATNRAGVYGPSPETFGHSGWGGSFGCANVEANVAIGYVMNRMGATLVGDPRTTPLCDAVFACLA